MKIGITNLKGGVGKTTITQNLATCLTKQGYKVAILDTDQNQNSLSWYGLRDTEVLKPVFVFGGTNSKAIRNQIQDVYDNYDFILIDGTPSLSEMTTRIILASDLLLIPIVASANDLLSVQKFMERYEQAKEFRDEIPARFIINQYHGFNAEKSVIEVLDQLDIPVLKSKIRERVAYKEAVPQGRGVVEWSDQKAAAEIEELTTEILGIAKELEFIS